MHGVKETICKILISSSYSFKHQLNFCDSSYNCCGATITSEFNKNLQISTERANEVKSILYSLFQKESPVNSTRILDLCLFVPCFPAFFDLLISLGQ